MPKPKDDMRDLERRLVLQKFGPPVLLGRSLTRDELELLHRTKELYWLLFSKLVNDTLEEVPEELRPYLESLLQESSSVYGRKDP